MPDVTPKFKKYIKQQRLKWTPEREAVLREALDTEGHFEAEDLAFRLRKKGSRVSKATVYRTLPLLVEAGLLKEVIHGEKHQHFEHVHEGERHDHMICLKCGAIVEFRNESLRRIEKKICEENHFKPHKVVIEIFGYCKNCR
jgi:Fur family ferric uptake transcriptional regulator